MKKLILACALGVSATVAGVSLMGPVAAQPWAGGGDFRGLPDGSWRESCRYPQSRGSFLSAECRTSYDRWVQTQINLNNCRSGRVGNSDGRLVCEDQGGGWYPGGGGWNLPGGSWRQTCRYPVMRGSYLSAQCPTMGDRWNNATIDVRACRGRDISNQNGQLYCDGRGGGWGGGNGGWNGGGNGGWNGGGGRYPGGSWQESCRDGDMRGSTFSAQCRAGDGYWNGSSIDLRNCRSNRLGNSNGRLVCE